MAPNIVPVSFICVLVAPKLIAAELLHVQVLFRHGDRTPGPYLHFPTDPLSIRTPWEIEEDSQLTAEGARQEYILGTKLKERFGNFVDVHRKPSELFVLAGEDNRTSESAQAVLAGLFPADITNQISSTLPWRPVAIHTDELLDINTGDVWDPRCPRLAKKLRATPEWAALNTKYAETLAYLEEKSGLPVPDIREGLRVLDTLLAEKRQPDTHPAPEWAYEGPMVDLIQHNETWSYQLMTHVPDAFRVNCGFTYGVILAGIQDFIEYSRHKMLLYSYHDTNLNQLILALDIPTSVIDRSRNPLVGAHMIFELHSVDGEFVKRPEQDIFVKVFYSNYFNSTATEVPMLNCPTPCSVEKFSKIMKPLSRLDFITECGLGDTAKLWRFMWTIVALSLSTALFLGLWVITCCCCLSARKQAKKQKDEERTPLVDNTAQPQPSYL